MIDFTKIKKLFIGGVELKQLFIESLVNGIPNATDTDGSLYNGKGYKENVYLSSSGVASNRTGIYCTGFIRIGVGSAITSRGEQVIYLDKVTAQTTTDSRICLYDANKSFIGIQYGSSMLEESADDGTATPTYTVGADGNINKIDITGYTAYIQIVNNKAAAYFRICCPNIDSNSVIATKQKHQVWKSGYKNWVKYSTEADGVTIYNGGQGCMYGYRLNSSGEVKQADGANHTGYIPMSYGEVIRAKGSADAVSSGANYFSFYDASFVRLGTITLSNATSAAYFSATYTRQSDGLYMLTLETGKAGSSTQAIKNAAWFRISLGNCKTEDFIVTINEEID